MIGTGGFLVVAGAVVVTTISLGRSGSESRLADGRVVSEWHRTASVWQSSRLDALIWIGVALAVSVLFGTLIRFGGNLGAAIVTVTAVLCLLASLLSIGIFFAPGVVAFVAAAIVARSEHPEVTAAGGHLAPPKRPTIR